MSATTSPTTLAELSARVGSLESRLAALERVSVVSGSRPRARRSSGSDAPASALEGIGWTTRYVPVVLDVPESWIDMHEHSARPQLQRLIRDVVEGEGPITDRLALDRVRRAWGLKRAGGRVQEAFDQALRQLVSRGLIERAGDALIIPGSEFDRVRVPGDDESTKRVAEDVPLVELATAIGRAAEELSGGDENDLTMQVAQLFGWTRRGASIQERLDAALARAVHDGLVRRADGRVDPV